MKTRYGRTAVWLEIPEGIDLKVGWELYQLGIVVAEYGQEGRIRIALSNDRIDDLKILLEAIQKVLESVGE